MNIFETLSASLFWVGVFFVEWDPGPKKRYIIMAMNCVSIGIGVIFSVTCTWFFLINAKTPTEHRESLFSVLLTLLILVLRLTFFWNGPTYIALFSELTTIIGKSKTKLIFSS